MFGNKQKKIGSFFTLFLIVFMLLAPISNIAHAQGQFAIETPTSLQGACGEGWLDFEFAIIDVFIDPKCQASIIYSLFVSGTSILLLFSANMFDSAVDFGVFGFGGKKESESASDEGGEVSSVDWGKVAKSIWVIFRDLVNMAFIFLLVYLGISIMLGINSSGSKRIIAKLVLVAILINFSLFIAQAVVDVSNLAAAEIRNSVTTPDGQVSPELSLPIAIAFNPVQIITPKTFEAWIDGVEEEGESSLNYYKLWIVFLLFGAVNLFASYLFLAMAFLLIIRVVVLLFLMALAPVGFFGMILPKTQKSIGDKWWNSLFKNAFLAPLLLFAVFLTLTVVNDPSFAAIDLEQAGETLGQLEITKLLSLLMIKLTMVLAFLYMGMKLARDMGAYGASKAMSIGKGLKGVGVGLIGAGVGAGTLGVAARLGRSTAGRYASSVAGREDLQKRATQGGVGGWWAQKRLSGAQKVSEGSFDVRGSDTFKTTMKASGFKPTALGKSKEGGFEGGEKRRAEKDVDFARQVGQTTLTRDEERTQAEASKNLATLESSYAEKTSKEDADKKVIKLEEEIRNSGLTDQAGKPLRQGELDQAKTEASEAAQREEMLTKARKAAEAPRKAATERARARVEGFRETLETPRRVPLGSGLEFEYQPRYRQRAADAIRKGEHKKPKEKKKEDSGAQKSDLESIKEALKKIQENKS